MSETVLQRLFNLQALTGANVAQNVPESITDRCPLWVTFEQQADEDYARHGQEIVEETTTYLMALYVAPLTDGTADGRYRLAREYIQRTRAIFAPRRGLEYRDPATGTLSDVTFDATFLGYQGPTVAAYPQGSENYFLTVYFRQQVGQVHLLDYNFDTSFLD